MFADILTSLINIKRFFMQSSLKKTIVATAFLLTGVFTFTACQNSGDKASSENKQSKAAQETVSSREETVSSKEETVTEVSFIGENDQNVSLSSLKGKVVFINFWATWCPPCKEELPAINKLKQSYKDNKGIQFLMVDVDSKMKQSAAFMKNNGYDLPVYVAKGAIPPNFLGNAIPTTVILDKEGKMAAHFVGARDYTSPEIKQMLDSLIKS